VRRRCSLSRVRTALIAIALLATASPAAAITEALIALPGDQSWPAIAGSYVAYLDDNSPALLPELWFADLSDATKPLYTPIYTPAASDREVLGGPDIAGFWIAYRLDGTVELYDIRPPHDTQSFAAEGKGALALSTSLVAWEEGIHGDVAWRNLSAGATIVLPRVGRQHSLAVAYDWIAYVDDSDGGSVHLLDTSKVAPGAADPFAGADVEVWPASAGPVGAVLDVAIWAPGLDSTPTVAILSTLAAGAEVVVFDPMADPKLAPPVHLPSTTGKQNLHLYGEWVAYEDVELGLAQVRLKNWKNLREFSPPWKAAPQTLNNLAGSNSEMRVVWTEAGAADLDIWKLTVALPLPPPAEPPGDAVACSSAVDPLAELTVNPALDRKARRGHGDADDGEPGKPDHDAKEDGGDGWHVKETGAHDERWHGERVWRGYDHDEFADDSARRVLVCIEAVNVASAWVGVGSEIIAAPSDFAMGTTTLEARVTVPAKEGRAAAVVIANRGGTLHVRVFDDPGGNVNGPPEGSTCSARGDCPPPPSGILGKFGCGSSGGAATLASLLLVGLLVARPSRRRSRP
jgi:hypothetical protein